MANAKLSYPERAHKLWEKCEWKSRAVVKCGAVRLEVNCSALLGIFILFGYCIENGI